MFRMKKRGRVCAPVCNKGSVTKRREADLGKWRGVSPKLKNYHSGLNDMSLWIFESINPTKKCIGPFL